MIDDEKIADQMLSERSTRPSILSIVNEDQNYQDLISRLQNSINPLSISYVADSHSEVRFRGVAICWNPTSIFYVNFDQLLTEGRDLFESNSGITPTLSVVGNIVKDLLHNYRGCQIMFDAKKTCAYSLEAFLDGKIRFRCCQIAAWMLHSDRSSRSLKAFVLEFIPNAWKVFEGKLNTNPDLIVD